jgi:hypothetical protein
MSRIPPVSTCQSLSAISGPIAEITKQPASRLAPRTRTSGPGAHLDFVCMLVDIDGHAPVRLTQYVRDNWLSNRVFPSYTDIVDHCCFNWNKLVIDSGSSRPSERWAHGS